MDRKTGTYDNINIPVCTAAKADSGNRRAGDSNRDIEIVENDAQQAQQLAGIFATSGLHAVAALDGTGATGTSTRSTGTS